MEKSLCNHWSCWSNARPTLTMSASSNIYIEGGRYLAQLNTKVVQSGHVDKIDAAAAVQTHPSAKPLVAPQLLIEDLERHELLLTQL